MNSSDADEGGGILSRVGWSIRGNVSIRLGSLYVAEGRYLVSTRGGGHRVFSLLRVRLSESPPDSKLDYASAMKATLQQQRMKGLFDGLHRTRVPFLYLILVKPAQAEGDGAESRVFEFDLVVGTWADGKGKDTSTTARALEQNINVLAASLSVGVPDASVRRITRNDLKMVVQSLLLPAEPKLPQVADSTTLSTLQSFDGTSPAVSSEPFVPNFYIPNAAESGKDGMLIGKVKARSGDLHDFRIQLEDMKRHLTLLGMSVDYEEPIIFREKGQVGIERIGTLVDRHFKADKEGRAYTEDLECVSFDPRTSRIDWAPIQYVLRHRYSGGMLRFTLESGRQVTVTPGHSLFVLRDGQINVVEASHLRLGDYLLGTKALPEPENHERTIDLTELFGKHDNFFLYDVPEGVFVRFNGAGRRTLKHDRRLPIQYADLLRGREREEVRIGYKRIRSSLKTVLTVNESFARLLGYYTAEGGVSIKDKRYYKVHFTFGKNDSSMIEDLLQILERDFGIKAKLRPHRGESIRVEFGHRLLCSLLLSLVGSGAKNKRVPHVILNSPSSVRWAFTKAWLSGDSGVSVSRELVNAMMYMLLLDNCIATVTHWAPRKDTVIEGRHVRSLPAYRLRFSRSKEMTASNSRPQSSNQLLYPLSQLPNPLSGICRLRGNRKKLNEDMQRHIQARLARLESYVGTQPPVTRYDGFYRANSGRFLKRTSDGIRPKPELLLAREEFESLRTMASSKLGFLKLVRIEEVRPTGKYVYDVSVPNRENFLAGFGGIFCHNTGAGKSTTAAVLTRQLAGLGLPVMVLDWHNEHGSVIRNVGGTVFVPAVDNFTLNPLEFGSTSDPVEHIALVTDIFSDIYKFTHPQAYMFRNALQKCLSEASDYEVPTLSSLVRIIEGYPLRSAYDNETKVALLRRLVPLTQGQAGKALDGPSTCPIEELLDKVICVELGHMRDLQTRSIFANILLKMVYENRLTREGRTEHIMLVEEARNIAPARREEDPPSVGERMISELRKFGEAMIFVAQFPTQVSSEVIKNSGVRIIHRLAWAEDLKLVGQSLNLTQEQLAHIANLGVGEVVVSLARLQKPILVQVSADSVLSAESSDLSLRGEP